MPDDLQRELLANAAFKRRQRTTEPRPPAVSTSNSGVSGALARGRMPALPVVPATNSGAAKALGGTPMPPLPAVPAQQWMPPLPATPRRMPVLPAQQGQVRRGLAPPAPMPALPATPTAPGKTVILYEESKGASEMHSLFATVGVEDSHRARALALSRVIPNSASAKTSLAPVTIRTLTRLVFWGHGSPIDFCHFSPSGFAEHLAKWRALNPGLQRVDLPTCNVRHFDPEAVDISQRRSFTDALKPELARLGLDDLDIRTVPMVATGPAGGMSKLHWNAKSQSWAFLAAKGAHSDYHQVPGVEATGDYHDLETRLKNDVTADGRMSSYTGDLATKVQQLHADGVVGAGMAVGGHIGDLMDFLEPI